VIPLAKFYYKGGILEKIYEKRWTSVHLKNEKERKRKERVASLDPLHPLIPNKRKSYLQREHYRIRISTLSLYHSYSPSYQTTETFTHMHILI